MTGPEKLMTVEQVAERCECSAKTIRRAINAGSLVVVRLGQSAKSDRVRESDLQAFIAGAIRRVQAAPNLELPKPGLYSTTADERVGQMLGPARTHKGSMNLLTLPQVIDRTGKARASIYRDMAAGKFPRARKDGNRTVWLESEVDQWKNALPAMQPTRGTAPRNLTK